MALVVEAGEAVEQLAAGGVGDGEVEGSSDGCTVLAVGECLSEQPTGSLEEARPLRRAMLQELARLVA